MVLTFHNDKRKTLARGDQPGKDGNKLSPAKQMNELVCICISVASACNITKETETVLNEWWNEVTVVGLGADLKYTDNSGLEEFANMAYFEPNAFACSYAKCTSEIRLLCLYNKLGKVNDQALYEAAANADAACDGCPADAPCEARLCQPKFTIAANDDQCADDGMTNDMTNSALYMHNYYRGLLGTGWAEDKISTYAPLAKAMPQLNYECGTIAKEAKDRAQACKETPDDPTAPRSQNYLVIKDLSMDKEDALKQAISTWWKELADVGLGEDTTYKAAMKNTLGQFANMAYDQTKQVGCSVETCTKQGFTLVVCQYDKLISDGKKIYETGKSGDKACAGCATTKCGDLQGLCAP
ncbi:hypothetical protein RB195_017374 [Necator americanus]|uniref:SCP domain-containing protein n=1 Tax=Necator americanus TaxID=51031 RepID=A0ABR1C7F7_NECAM